MRATSARSNLHLFPEPALDRLFEIHQTDAFEWLRSRAQNSIHAVVTDPPYGLLEYTDEQKQKLRVGRGGVWRIPPSFDGWVRRPLPRFTSVMPRSCWEPWGLFRKPCEGRVQDNLRKWRTGGLRRISAAAPFRDLILSSPTRRAEHQLAPHPSLKPQHFLRQLVRAALPFGVGTILDPFMGSGCTIAASAALGLRSIGLEIDPEYFVMARNAIPKLAAFSTLQQ